MFSSYSIHDADHDNDCADNTMNKMYFISRKNAVMYSIKSLLDTWNSWVILFIPERPGNNFLVEKDVVSIMSQVRDKEKIWVPDGIQTHINLPTGFGRLWIFCICIFVFLFLLGYGFESLQGLGFSLCPTFVTWWTLHPSHFITEFKTCYIIPRGRGLPYKKDEDARRTF